MPTAIVASVQVRDRAELERQAAGIDFGSAGDADLLEVRADGWRESGEALAGALAAVKLPTIATVRARWEGGGFTGSEEERRRLLHAAAATAAWVDVEARARFAGESFAPAKKIVSRHDFEATPPHLLACVQELRQAAPDAALLKLATNATRADDVMRLAELTRACAAASPPIVVIGMGELGQPLRLLAGKLGAPLVYGSLPGQEATAPGQPSIAALARLYRVRAQRPTTPACAVTGNPIAHSLGPLLHNTLYAAAGLERTFIPLRVETFADALRMADVLGLDGLSVTLPFKEEAARAAAGAAPGFPWPIPEGVVNTLLRRGDRWLAANTDRIGFLAALRAGAPEREWRERSALVLGAGGAARTVVAVLRELGARVTIASRTAARAAELARATGAKSTDLAPIVNGGAAGFDLVVNATPVGMYPRGEESPLAEGSLRSGQVVQELIYRPRRTRLLAQAESAGALAIDGFTMFLAQALAQFELFTGRRADPDLARTTLEQALAPR